MNLLPLILAAVACAQDQLGPAPGTVEGTAVETSKPAEECPKTKGSSLCEAKKDRKVDVDFSLFGKLDGKTYGKRKKPVSRILIHNGGYSAKMNDELWHDRPYPSHYTIERSGKIFQHVGEEMNSPHGESANPDSVGIELNITCDAKTKRSCNEVDEFLKRGKPEDQERVKAACAPTDEQYKALADLVADIAARQRFAVTDESVLGHCEVTKPGPHAHGDPRALDWSRLGLSNQAHYDSGKKNGGECGWYHLYLPADK